MVIPLKINGAFVTEQALRGMIVRHKVCFDHDPFYVRDGSGQAIQIGFQLNLYAAFQDARHLPVGDDPEYRELISDLNRLCRVFFQSLDLLKPCEHPEPPVHRIVFSPERRNRAEVCLQIPIFDREQFGVKASRRVHELLAVAECLLKEIGARPGRWEEDEVSQAKSPQACEQHVQAAMQPDGPSS